MLVGWLEGWRDGWKKKKQTNKTKKKERKKEKSFDFSLIYTVHCLSLQGFMETFSGLGLMVGPPLGGVLYSVSSDLMTCKNVIIINIKYGGTLHHYLYLHCIAR